MYALDDQLLIGKLKSREDELRLTHAAAQASESAFKSVWNNSDDADYGSMQMLHGVLNRASRQ